MRILNGVFMALMILFMAVQFNDPDGLWWAAIYGVGAVWCGIACFAPSVYAGGAFHAYAASCVAAVAGSVYYWPKTPHFWMQDVWWETETAREGMGMWFLGLSLAVAAFVAFRQRA